MISLGGEYFVSNGMVKREGSRGTEENAPTAAPPKTERGFPGNALIRYRIQYHSTTVPVLKLLVKARLS